MDDAVAAVFTMSTVTTLGLNSWLAPTPAPTPRPTPYPTVIVGNPAARPVTPHRLHCLHLARRPCLPKACADAHAGADA